jgi:hypothetical protein
VSLKHALKVISDYQLLCSNTQWKQLLDQMPAKARTKKLFVKYNKFIISLAIPALQNHDQSMHL